MPVPQLTVHNAEIKTATVEIKTLTVSGKQVTLAVFRQLHEALPTSGAALWGWVNHCPDKSCERAQRRQPGPHRHIVWQDGDELRRATLWTTTTFDGSSPEWRARQRALWDEARTLPQLFIAV